MVNSERASLFTFFLDINHKSKTPHEKTIWFRYGYGSASNHPFV